ncbi:MAG TPA: hypothetical protein H9812_08140 [Candidatus Gallimonas intestinigallinarum]|uniref:Uncharacterized protein n=1 Tax=Candidatus Gallimonas intestinigallinarum TaxID=2838604 RepID=A0A9D2DYQ8_9FIRM|nr:hypothetical protein [Candidatus Gallimonas intestinigallinarum]
MTEEENTTQGPEDTTKVDLGKFQNVDALMRAYKELEAEFTRRSQRLRALEAAAAQSDEAQPKRAEADAHEELYRAVKGDEGVCARIVGEYLASCKGVPILGGGGAGVTAPVKRAQTFKDAGNMALGYFKLQK